jgi:hypothetical protein
MSGYATTQPLAVGCDVLCVPSMGTVLVGLKSPVLKPKHDENILMKIPAKAKVSESDLWAKRRQGKTHEPMNKNLIQPERSGDSQPKAAPQGWAKPSNADATRRAGTTQRSHMV